MTVALVAQNGPGGHLGAPEPRSGVCALGRADFRPADRRLRSREQLDELGPNLRIHVEGAMAEKANILRRLGWPYDPGYDLRALERSGIADPFQTGLLSKEAA